MKLALKNIESIKVYYHYAEMYRLIILMKDKTVRGGYFHNLNQIGEGRDTIKKYMARAERTITPCGAGYSTAEYKL